MRASSFILGAAGLTLALGVMGCSGSAASNSDAPTPASGTAHGAVTGTVTVRSGNEVVCVMTIKAGKGSCKVSTKNYAPGTLRFDASYSGGPGYKPAHGSTTLKLLPKPSTGG